MGVFFVWGRQDLKRAAARSAASNQPSGLDLALVQNFLHLFGGEVGQTDGADLARLVSLFHQAVTGQIVAGRLVDEQQVDKEKSKWQKTISSWPNRSFLWSAARRISGVCATVRPVCVLRWSMDFCRVRPGAGYS